jgi:hypothetical protein
VSFEWPTVWLLSFQVYVFFLDESKSGLGAVKTCVEKMKQGNVASGILVLQKALSGAARTAVLQSKKCRLEVFEVAPLHPCLSASCSYEEPATEV